MWMAGCLTVALAADGGYNVNQCAVPSIVLQAGLKYVEPVIRICMVRIRKDKEHHEYS